MKDYLNFIDISSWQADIKLDEVFRQNPLDGVVVKATGGTKYVNPKCDPWVQWLIKNGKPWGFYHYLDDDNKSESGKKEAEYFVENCLNYFGDGMPFADYEGNALKLGTGYLFEFLETVKSMTGCTPGVYTSLSVIQDQDFREIAAAGYPLWLAQYASSIARMNFDSIPYQQGSYAPFEKIVMHQYSPAGKLNGYNGNLDLDKFYGTREDWDLMTASIKNDYPPILDDGPEEPDKKQWIRDEIEFLEGEKANIQNRINYYTRRLEE